MTKICIFCCKPGTSEEHLWSKALGPEIEKWLPKKPIRSYKALQRGDGTEENRLAGMYLHHTTVPCVCERCNNGWMNRSDERTRLKTIRLIRGQDASFTEEDAHQLASWLAMKMFVRDEYKLTQTIFSSDDKANFFLTGLPPRRMWIGLGYARERRWATAFHRQWRRQSSKDAEFFQQAIWTMGLGATVAFVEYGTVDHNPRTIPPNQVVQLWPAPHAFEWPTYPILTASQIRYLSVRYDLEKESAGDLSGQRRFTTQAGFNPRRT